MTIDCHAHAFPDLDYHLKRIAGALPASAADWCERLALASARRGRRPHPEKARPPRLGIEELAAWRDKAPPAILRVMELAASVVAAPAMVFLAGTLDHLFASMARHGIERTVVIGGPPLARNDWLLAEAAARSDGRLILVTTLPELPPEAPEEAWYRAFDELADGGARGFKIHPNMDGIPPNHPAYRALFEVARDRDRFVILHTGCFHVATYKHRHAADPEEFSAYFAAYPEVRTCLAHMGREHPEKAWNVMRRFDQLFADTSWQPASTVRRALEKVGASRLLLGSDWPLLHPEVQGDALGIVRSVASDADCQQILEDSPLAFLGA
jgi:predicted TIM-barrel fold metal-dependent hydrolase